MGGRGAFALRRRLGGNFAAGRLTRRGGIVGSGTSGAGVEPSVKMANGTAIHGAGDAAIQSALGANFNREIVAKMVGAPANSKVNIIASGNRVTVETDNRGANFRSQFSLVKEGAGVTFVGSSLFSGNASKESGGAAIRGIVKGLREGVETGRIAKATVPSAIGSAGSKSAQGSGLWARMGISTDLSSISGLAARPAGLRSAKTVADLQLSKAGQAWWSANRVGFSGSINFRDKSSSSYKVASRFLGLGRRK